MAKRKKRSRSRRMGATKGNPLMDSVAVIAGAAAGRIVSQRLLPNLNPNIKNVGIIALGAFAMPRILKGSLGKGLGDGMVAAGGLGLLSGFGVIAGDDSVMAGDDSVMAGDDLSVVAGDPGIAADNLSVIAGLDEMDSDY